MTHTSMELLPSARVRVAALPLDGRGANAKAFTFCFARSTCRAMHSGPEELCCSVAQALGAAAV